MAPESLRLKCGFNLKTAAASILLAAMLSSCHSTKKVTPGTVPGDPQVENIHIGKVNSRQKKILDEAYTWLGTPYKYAGVEKGSGVDCSGMVMKVYEMAVGTKIPRNSAKQAEFCIDMDASDVDAGDLVFFATGKDPARISHVGIVIDNENFIHASSSKGVVISKLTNSYFQRTFRKFGRVPREIAESRKPNEE